MSRSGYTEYDYCDDDDHLRQIGWRANVRRALAGKRGQAFLWEMYLALTDLPTRELIQGALVDLNGQCCALGAVALKRGLKIPEELRETEQGMPDDCAWDNVPGMLGIKSMIAQEIMYENDERDDSRYADTGQVTYGLPWDSKRPTRHDTPAERWQRMREWVVEQLRGIP